MVEPQILFDENDIQHELTKVIGEGGFGIVYATKNSEVIVKVAKDMQRKEYAEKVNRLFLLPLARGSHIILPNLMLKPPYIGYTMHFLSGMTSITSFLKPNNRLKDFYIETGGLRHRLLLLSKLARILYELHVKKIVYCDLSPSNVFVSQGIESAEVRLIDPDNLQYEKQIKTAVCTPGYGAPELYDGGCNSTRSDVYAFAALAVKLLTLVDPFDGALLDENAIACDWDDGDAKSGFTFHDAEMGLLPWIYEKQDMSNRTDKGIRIHLVVPRLLYGLLDKSLGRKGRMNPCERPSIYEFAKELQRSYNLTVCCPVCKATHFRRTIDAATKEIIEHCPFCGEPIQRTFRVTATDIFLDEDGVPERKEMVWEKFLDDVAERQYLTNHDLYPTPMLDEHKAMLAIEINKTRPILTLTNLSVRNLTRKEIRAAREETGILLVDMSWQMEFDKATLEISLHPWRLRCIEFVTGV